MTDDEIRALLDGATPGPWHCRENILHGRRFGGCWVEGPEVEDDRGLNVPALIPMSGSGGSMSYTTRLIETQGHDYNDANARLIAAAPSLTAEVLRLREALREADLQLAYLDERQPTGTTPAIRARIAAALKGAAE